MSWLSAWATSLGLDDVASLLDETLAEEKAADEKLTDVGGEVLSEAEEPQKKGITDKTSGETRSRRRAG